MERLIEERLVDGHRVMILEDLEEEGTGYVLIIDDVLADEIEPLGHIPADEEIRILMRSRGIH